MQIPIIRGLVTGAATYPEPLATPTVDDPRVSVETRGAVAIVTLKSIPLNVFGWALIEDLRITLARLHDEETRVVVLRSGLDGAFSAGVDVSIHTKELAPRMLRRFHRLIEGIRSTDSVVIASVDGVCLGGAFELALACDFVVAGPNASFGFPEIDLACFPPVASVLLGRRARQLGADLLMTGRRIGAGEAATLGLAARVVRDGSVDGAAAELAESIAAKSRPAIAATKRALRVAERGSFARALRRAERIYERAILRSEDAAEGVAAFAEKRPAVWRHR